MPEPAFPLDPEEVAREIGLPLAVWPGNCHAVALGVLTNLPTRGMRLVRGHYHGRIARKSAYRAAGPQQHSWLRLGDGRILDPTRWAMERPDQPFIYIGLNDHYDEAGVEVRLRSRAAWHSSILAIGQPDARQGLVRRCLSRAPEGARVALLEACGCGDGRIAERIIDALEAPVEHIARPEALYSAAQQCGLKALIRLDCWTRVMEPESVSPSPGRNLFYEPPPAPVLSNMEKLFRVMAHFLSIEERELMIEAELDELGYELEDLHEALNEMEKWLRFDPDLTWMPGCARDLLCVVASDLLGKGFGVELRVERYADSLGLDRNALHRSMVEFARPAGFDLAWLWGEEARRTEVAQEEPASERFRMEM